MGAEGPYKLVVKEPAGAGGGGRARMEKVVVLICNPGNHTPTFAVLDCTQCPPSQTLSPLFTLFTLSNLPSQPPPRLTSPSTLPTPSSPPPPPPLQANGRTALLQACSKGHQEAVCVLLELGASLHYTNVCVSALCWLHTACRAALLLQG